MRFLEDTEEQLASFGPVKRLALSLGAAAMIVAGAWYGWIDDTEADIERTAAHNVQLEQQIRLIDLRRVSKKIEDLRKKRLATAEKLEESVAAVRYLRTQMDRLQKLRFDQNRMADLLDGILKKSVDLGLRIDMIESVDSPLDVTPLLERKKRIKIEGGGAFARIVKLTHYIESRATLAKIDSLDIFLDDKGKTAFKIDILAYGAKE